MTFNGLPLHPLIVHVVVVFAPLAGIGAIVYAVMPRWRWWLRWPLVAAAVISAVAGVIAVQSGHSLLNSRPDLRPLVQTHQHRGKLLELVMIAFLVPVGLSAWLLGGPSALVSGGGARQPVARVVGIGLQVLLLVGAVAVLVMVFLTGDSGARAIWGQ
jgi:uncharacterized membrane protein